MIEIPTNQAETARPQVIANTGGKDYLLALTSCRFFAALMILLDHAGLPLAPNCMQWTKMLCLDQGVSFFFVLSGFIIYHSYAHLEGLRDTKLFLIARFARIWPTHFVTFVCAAIMFSTVWLPVGGRTPWITAANVFLLQSWVPQSPCYFSFNAPSWSISVEMMFYLIFPWLASNWERTWKVKLIGASIISFLMLLICEGIENHATHTGFPMVLNGLLYVNPLARMLEFVLGMACALAFRTYRQSDFMRSGKVATLIELAVVSVALSMPLLSYVCFSANGIPKSPLCYWLQYTIGAPIFAVLIFAFALQKGAVSKFLSLPIFVLLGEISYSIYLIHWLVLQWFQDHRGLFGSSAPLRFELYLIGVFVLAYANFVLIERPFRSFVKGRLHRV